MPKLIIDDQEIEVAPGTKVIEAAEQLGIMIPRFCFHPALGSVGACRVCAVKFLQGPFKGLQMSCMIEAQDGLVVSTTDQEALEFRRYVIEWLMLHHPHDCPVCDEGGHCLLQDMTESCGHGIRRYQGKKRTYRDQYLGPLLQHEMNRCIHCYRCARYYQEFAGYRDLGVMQIANRTYFGRFEDGILQSPFSGNLSDICPTGVYTDKPSRYFGRRWDYRRNPSVCIHCSLGCHTVVSIRYREVKRQEALFSPQINGHFICDRGRYGFYYTSLESRPRHATVDDKTVSSDEALRIAREKLSQISKDSGPSSIAVAGSARCSLETQTMLKHACRENGWRPPVFFDTPELTLKVQTAIARLEPDLKVSMREVETADFILAVGADPVNEAPMLALALRQANRNGAAVVVLDPRPVGLPFEFQHFPEKASDLGDCLAWIIKGCGDRESAASLGGAAVDFFAALPDEDSIPKARRENFGWLIEELKKCRRPVIVCGTDIVPGAAPGLAADLTLFLRAAGKTAGLFYLLPGANAYGAGLLSDTGDSWQQLIEGIEAGSIRSLILAESDPFDAFSDRMRLEKATAALGLLIVLDYLDSRVVRKAQIFIPSATLYETGGGFINQEGRLQAAPDLFKGGLPIEQTGGGSHPPRVYGTGIPGADTPPAWRLLSGLSRQAQVTTGNGPGADMYAMLAETIPEFAGLASIAEIPPEGVRIGSGTRAGLRFSDRHSAPSERREDDRGDLEIVLTDSTFGTEALSSRSRCLQELEPEPVVYLHSSDAKDLGLSEDDRIAIRSPAGSFETKLKVAGNMAPGVLVIVRLQKLDWQIFEIGAGSIQRNQIEKINA